MFKLLGRGVHLEKNQTRTTSRINILRTLKTLEGAWALLLCTVPLLYLVSESSTLWSISKYIQKHFIQVCIQQLIQRLPKTIPNTMCLLSGWWQGLKICPFDRTGREEQIWSQKCKKFKRKEKHLSVFIVNRVIETRWFPLMTARSTLITQKTWRLHQWPQWEKGSLQIQVRGQGIRRRCPLRALMSCCCQASWQGTATPPVKEQKENVS